ncbi:hypothetical protein [Microbacterium sp.]|uniref:hypothetical protein n=1 Tax=Microbacterium sp. TaxID=51671 RepID=UPI003C75FC87
MADQQHPKAADVTISRGDGIAVLAILVLGAGLGGWIAGMGLIRGVFRLFDPSRYPVELLATVPVKAGKDAIEAHADTIQVTFSQLQEAPLWLLSLSDISGAVAIGLATASFAFALARIVSGKPFHRSMQSAALIAGSSIMFGGLLAQGLGGLGQMMVALDLGAPAEPAFTFEPLPIIVGAAVLALVYVFRAGRRLQRDTEGLV